MIPVVISGGSGTRLWPVSRATFPKQFCPVIGEQSLQTLTLKRCAHLGTPWVLTSQSLRVLTELEFKALGMDPSRILLEPVGKNTAPAAAFLLRVLTLRGEKDSVVGVFPSDHLIRDELAFLQAVAVAKALAQQGQVVTIGVRPNYPETGYGYIQTEKDHREFRRVHKFHEKPSLEKAQEFIRAGGFYWNAGIFVFKVSRMAELFAQHQPRMWSLFEALKPDLSNLAEIYEKVNSISLDYAIMEKLGPSEMSCVPTDMGWSDVGSWDSVVEEFRALGKDSDGVKPILVKSENNFVRAPASKTVALVGVNDLIVVDTQDALLVVRKGTSQDLREVVERLNKSNSSVAREHPFERRPWGEFEVLRDTEQFKSKVIRVNPHSQISYQSHSKREEHWIITRGQGEVVLNDEVIPVKSGSHLHIPIGAKHRIRNNSDSVLEFVEVQLGTYFGEDDIIRYQDDYKRV
ncbi:MAG: mannose-1-phosphate guanylyltransferase/mannose-6-phosphate isomerase [Bdellovibrionaceae bacterium]|nr:mannose-1-phosphate guanylyltransferase/mannose-6-phosphate isomerase [Pseudobdellovibrionaceae bacterium]